MTELVKLRSLPGIAEIEAALHVPGRHLLPEYDELPVRISNLSLRLFGITDEDTAFGAFALDNGETITVNAEYYTQHEEWEKHFEFLNWEYDEEDVFWSAMGWDVGDESGEPLLILEYFGRQLVCLVKRLHPRARLSISGNDPLIARTGADADREAEAWGQRLADEARLFRRMT